MSTQKNIREARKAIEAAGLRVVEVRHDSKTRILTNRGQISIPESPNSFDLGAIRRTAFKMARSG